MEHWHCWHRTQICESWGLAWTWIEERGTRTCCLTSFPTYSPSHNSRVWIITMRFNFRLRNLTRNQKLLWNSSSSSENSTSSNFEFFLSSFIHSITRLISYTCDFASWILYLTSIIWVTGCFFGWDSSDIANRKYQRCVVLSEQCQYELGLQIKLHPLVIAEFYTLL